ncbi:ribbon-helix-helix domain-containing protein [uncultured Methanomethylovorans sp.]|uniref:ribbon-helix-helix domain-containing protein n=1 Tax=uncultured Methanomethylovorans sp. TaxID=183759 RepID=UPI0026332708|nr:ribbon-helix-helix domain-containing protein [uncultured Methanomethylovorans sp.]
MEKERYTFRLSPETIGQLDELVEKGVIQNRTEGVIKGIAMLHSAELYKGPVHDLIYKMTKSPELIQDWDKFPDGAEIPFYGIPGVKIMITKLGPQHVKIVRDFGEGVVMLNELEVKSEEGKVISKTSM